MSTLFLAPTVRLRSPSGHLSYQLLVKGGILPSRFWYAVPAGSGISRGDRFALTEPAASICFRASVRGHRRGLSLLSQRVVILGQSVAFAISADEFPNWESWLQLRGAQAAAENGDSRVYAGIHFRSAVEDGITQGEKIGHFVFRHALQPLNRDDDDEDRDR